MTPNPVTPPGRGVDLPITRRYVPVLAAVPRVERVCAGLAPETYRGGDVFALLAQDPVGWLAGGPACEPDVFESAARYLGHVVVVDPALGRLLRVLRATERAEHDALVLAHARRAADASEGRVGVRATQKRCQRPWVSSWGIRGALERAAAAGTLRVHPDCRREPTTVWMFTST